MSSSCRWVTCEGGRRGERRHRHLHELPSRPCPPDDPASSATTTFKGFERRGGRLHVNYVCMAEYDATMPNCEVAYPPVELKNVLGEYSVQERQDPAAHRRDREVCPCDLLLQTAAWRPPYEGEDRKVVPSPKVATYDLKPEIERL